MQVSQRSQFPQFSMPFPASGELHLKVYDQKHARRTSLFHDRLQCFSPGKCSVHNSWKSGTHSEAEIIQLLSTASKRSQMRRRLIRCSKPEWIKSATCWKDYVADRNHISMGKVRG